MTHGSLLIGEKVAQDENLANSKNYHEHCFGNRPPHYSGVEILGALSSLGFVEAVMSLRINDGVHAFVNGLCCLFHLVTPKLIKKNVRLRSKLKKPPRNTNLRHSTEMFTSTRQRGFLSDLEVKVDQFVAESGELIAEANSINSGLTWCPRKRIKLFLYSLVKHFTAWSFQRHVNIIMSSSHHLYRRTGNLITNVKSWSF